MEKVSAVLITRDPSYPNDIKVDFPFDEVLTVLECPNVLQRFEIAKSAARNEIIYVQDDDCEIDIAHLWRCYDGRITNAITPGHHAMYRGTGVTLIGWGCFFHKSMIDFTRWEQQYGAVDAMEVDRIFTYLNQPHNTVFMPVRQVNRPVKMCERPGHYHRRDEIFRMLKELK